MNGQDALRKQTILVNALRLALEKTSDQVRLFETHISWVLVTERFAYKFKKAVRFVFLDYSTLEHRRFYCEEELRLNRRLAPNIYLDVIGITGDAEHPAIGGEGMPIEYAIKMHAFEQQSLWTYRMENKLLSASEIDALARKIAQFHQAAAIAAEDSAWGTPETVREVADDNFRKIAESAKEGEEKRWLNDLQSWQDVQQQNLSNILHRRKAQGWVRECHGDLHSRNILTIGDQVEVFDCIEFNESLRWTDVMNDVAFICMDLQFHGRRDWAARLLNQYLERTGDYEGLAVFDYYQVHRALVRCKVDLLRAQQLRAENKDVTDLEQQGEKYLVLAWEAMQPATPALMITHGFSGCGKSTFARHIVEALGAVQLRSDVERKRLRGVPITRRDDAMLYDPVTTAATYSRLAALSRHVIESGRPAIVDAAFLKREQRSLFARLAAELGIPFFIFDIHACEATMRSRIASRKQLDQDPSDAGLEVLAHQLEGHEPLTDEEIRHVISVDFEFDTDEDAVRKICEPMRNAIKRHPEQDANPLHQIQTTALQKSNQAAR